MEKRLTLPALPHLQHCRQLCRQHDWERYLFSLYQPSPMREIMWGLIAFNVEVARTAEAVSEEAIGTIRLKWWLEVLEAIEAGQEPREHPVAQTLDTLVKHYGLPLLGLKTMIEAREQDIGQGVLLADIATLDDYATKTGAGIWLPLMGLLGTDADSSERENLQTYITQQGQLWALVGLLRATGYHFQQEKTYIPQEMLVAHKVDFENLLQPEAKDTLFHILQALLGRIEKTVEMAADKKQKQGDNLAEEFESLKVIEVMIQHKITKMQKNITTLFQPQTMTERLSLQFKLLLRR